MLRERGTVLEVCPSSNLSTGVLSSLADVRRALRALVEHDVRFTISTDGPEMLRTYLTDELQRLVRNEILTVAEVERAIAVGAEASFLDRAPIAPTSVRRARRADNSRAAIPVEALS
jgi:adenosine deaminase